MKHLKQSISLAICMFIILSSFPLSQAKINAPVLSKNGNVLVVRGLEKGLTLMVFLQKTGERVVDLNITNSEMVITDLKPGAYRAKQRDNVKKIESDESNIVVLGNDDVKVENSNTLEPVDSSFISINNLEKELFRSKPCYIVPNDKKNSYISINDDTKVINRTAVYRISTNGGVSWGEWESLMDQNFGNTNGVVPNFISSLKPNQLPIMANKDGIYEIHQFTDSGKHGKYIGETFEIIYLKVGNIKESYKLDSYVEINNLASMTVNGINAKNISFKDRSSWLIYDFGEDIVEDTTLFVFAKESKDNGKSWKQVAVDQSSNPQIWGIDDQSQSLGKSMLAFKLGNTPLHADSMYQITFKDDAYKDIQSFYIKVENGVEQQTTKIGKVVIQGKISLPQNEVLKDSNLPIKLCLLKKGKDNYRTLVSKELFIQKGKGYVNYSVDVSKYQNQVLALSYEVNSKASEFYGKGYWSNRGAKRDIDDFTVDFGAGSGDLNWNTALIYSAPKGKIVDIAAGVGRSYIVLDNGQLWRIGSGDYGLYLYENSCYTQLLDSEVKKILWADSIPWVGYNASTNNFYYQTKSGNIKTGNNDPFRKDLEKDMLETVFTNFFSYGMDYVGTNSLGNLFVKLRNKREIRLSGVKHAIQFNDNTLYTSKSGDLYIYDENKAKSSKIIDKNSCGSINEFTLLEDRTDLIMLINAKNEAWVCENSNIYTLSSNKYKLNEIKNAVSILEDKNNGAYILTKDGFVYRISVINNEKSLVRSNLVVKKIKISNVKKIATGLNHVLFLLKDGSLYASGTNYNGELGLPFSVSRAVEPVKSKIPQNNTDNDKKDMIQMNSSVVLKYKISDNNYLPIIKDNNEIMLPLFTISTIVGVSKNSPLLTYLFNKNLSITKTEQSGKAYISVSLLKKKFDFKFGFGGPYKPKFEQTSTIKNYKCFCDGRFMYISSKLFEKMTGKRVTQVGNEIVFR